LPIASAFTAVGVVSDGQQLPRGSASGARHGRPLPAGGGMEDQPADRREIAFYEEQT